MDVATERKDYVLSVLVSGRIDSANAAEFGEAVRAAIEDGDRAVIMDLEKLTYISSPGLRVLLMFIRDLLRRETAVAFCTMSEQVRKVITISGFDQFIPIHPTRAAALSSFGA